MDHLRPCLAALALILTGCAVPTQKNGTTHYLVIGFGVVSVPSTNVPNAQVVKSQAIGLILSDQPGTKVGVGYASSTVVQIATNQNILLEVSDRPGSPLKIQSK